MKANRHVFTAALLVLGLAALLVPANVGAQKVMNPGTFRLAATGGQIRIGTNGLLPVLDLTPQVLAQCENLWDDDADGRIDSLDPQCTAGPQGQPDDSELVPGYQPKTDVSITGTVNADGQVTILPANVVFPRTYIGVSQFLPGAGLQGILTASIEATAPATGSIDPLSGLATLAVKLRLKLSGDINGAALSNSCYIGTPANPITLNLTTGIKPAIGSNPPAAGTPYDATNGTARMVDNAFAVPGAVPGVLNIFTGNTGCQAGFLELSGIMNPQLGLPTGAGQSLAILEGKVDPILARAIQPKITMTPGTAGPAPFFATFSAAQSVVAKGPATYAWTFSEGTNLSGQQVTRTFSTPGADWAVLTVTDADGHSATSRIDFVTGQPGSTTTTTAPTTTTTAPTTTTTAPTTTTTTTAPTTTTTTTSTTTTTTTTTTTPTTTTTAPTTTTTAPTTTTTAPTTTTTAPTTTTTAPTTTTTTTTPPAGSDSVSVSVTGAVNYANSGSGSGLTVSKDAFGIQAVNGQIQIPSTSSGAPAKVTVNAQRAWILPLWTGQVSVVDSAANVSVSAPVFGSISNGTAANSAKATSSWFLPGTFPNLIRPFTLTWNVVDAG